METFYDKVKAGKHILLIYEYAQVNSQLMPAELIETLAKERQSQNPDVCYLSEVNLVSVQCEDSGRNSWVCIRTKNGKSSSTSSSDDEPRLPWQRQHPKLGESLGN